MFNPELEHQEKIVSRLGMIINLMVIVKKITKYFTHIVFSLASLSILLSIKDFIEGSYVFGIINLALGIGGLIFVIQTLQWNRNTKSSQKIRNKNQSLMVITTLVGLKNNLTIIEDLRNGRRKLETDSIIAS